MWNEEKMNEYLKKNLEEERYIHSIGVMNTAVKMAKLYGCDDKKAKIAGLIHDCAKQMDKDKILELCKSNGYSIDYVEEKNPGIMHGAAGAIIAKKVMGVTDSSILSAIEYHTTGKKEMTLLQKIIYLADYIEPSRDFDGVEKLREEAFKDLNKAVLMGFDSTIKLVIEKGGLIHQNTIDARNYIICYEN
ncbi:MAG: bis(5'-nucleosyl)-tetraphosphatase (symmetrical) YqeK [Clostridium sp.]|nr:bis(5'-nucleosyl)-tetraphosphatase (symmetrical) YqeK [Clostridium sp.]